MFIEPKPPIWAIDRGLPEPEEGEDLATYARRLEIDPLDLFIDLTPRTVELAHVRFVHKIAEKYPEWWQEHVNEYVKAYAQQTINGHDSDLVRGRAHSVGRTVRRALAPPAWWEAGDTL